jgi:molybdenum cofactor biosynthesis protein A
MRCSYCMPASGNVWLSRQELLSYEEMLRICSVLVKMGIEKIRITGGEPFVRKDLMSFLEQLSNIQGLKEIAVTTNGLLTYPLIPGLAALGIRSINLSLDSLDSKTFFSITRRDNLSEVLKTLYSLLDHQMEVKINTVVMDGRNSEDIIPLVEFTRQHNVAVRFIEQMPFNGEGNDYSGIKWNYVRIMNHIRNTYPELLKLEDGFNSTSYNYKVPGYKGSVGVIAAYSRSFCGTCNRLRITPQGALKTCLYDKGEFNIKDLIRSGCGNKELEEKLQTIIAGRYKDGWEAEKSGDGSIHQSMATIGG